MAVNLTILAADFATLQKNSDQLFLLIMGCMVFLMQSGFAFLEAGSVRSKNTTNILIKNMLDIFITGLCYWMFGYAFAFGQVGNPFIGHSDFFAGSLRLSPDPAFWFFQFVFCATATTIVSGAMAERTEFVCYLVYCVVIGGFMYPVVTHWAWSDVGWLANGPDGIVYKDFAGSGVVHVVGGTTAFVGAKLLGPRIGRFKDGKAVQISGHTVPLVALGAFILFFGFLAFNGGSQASISGPRDGQIVSNAIVNTIISGAAGGVVAMMVKRSGLFGDVNWSLLTSINGALSGMVAICAAADAAYSWGALVIGVVAGMVYCAWSRLVVKLGVDDPLDAVAVHLGAGLWGVLAAPILASDVGLVGADKQYALRLFGWNLLGALVIMAWCVVVAGLMFGLLKVFGILRVPTEIELRGLDIPKHGEPAYPTESYGHGWTMMPPDHSPDMYGGPDGKMEFFPQPIRLDNVPRPSSRPPSRGSGRYVYNPHSLPHGAYINHGAVVQNSRM
ncbi:PREDICTED: putative ammonium transporter 1 [Branchiostoma belcheri]|uniref:Ammonium transporter n=1 Tax=Branchiostoma belcheri TaxID=7741 RepID=A0A6P4YRR4_BRABE|nr:PREDICTED: putative ammonium transporter 1 [Branchiostoma belcheri]